MDAAEPSLARAAEDDAMAARIRELTCENEALQRAASLQRAILDALPGLIAYWDRDLRCRFASASYREWFGVESDQLLGSTMEEVVGPDHFASNAPHVRAALRGEEQRFEREMPSLAGDIRSVNVRYLPHRVEGEVVGFAVLVTDITERKRAEGAVAELHASLERRVEERTSALSGSEERFARVFRGVPAGLMLARVRDRKIIEVNDRFLAMTGYDRGGAIGVTAVDLGLITSAHNAELRELAVRGRGASRDVETVYRRKDGTEGVFLVSFDTLDFAGEPHYLVSFVEITARKRAENEVLRLNAELDQRVRARTAELEGANRELEAFSYSVSHDLRTPLRAVNGFAGIVLEDFGALLPEEGRQLLVTIRESGRRMGTLIDDLLAFSRLGRQAVERHAVAVDAMVRSVVAELCPEPSAAIDIRVADLPGCHADAALLRQVWLNLISNAIKYSKPRNPAIIEIGYQSSCAQIVYFVRDNGVGFDMRYADKLFGVFQRLHSVAQFEGTGVGLAIVRRIVERHGGRVWVEASPGAGATFFFSIGAPAG